MRFQPSCKWFAAFVLCILAGFCLSWSAAARADKIPITTSSDEARELYLTGRDLIGKLRLTDAREYYERAVALDRDFALAHLGLANTSRTANEFFGSLDRAVALIAKVSGGERMMILGFEAGVRSRPSVQEENYVKLVETYPDDERARTLLGSYYFGRQEYTKALEHYKHATKINPEFSAPYNQLGYVYRFLEDYEAAEKAFKKYIELIPTEPNPYDSYAELLMKMGRFEESIENYKKALSLNQEFVASYIGIGNNCVFMGKGPEARKTYRELLSMAKNIGQRRQALLWTAVSHIHEGKPDIAVKIARDRHNLAKADDDFATMSADLIFLGTILLESGKLSKAHSCYVNAVDVMERANVPSEVKEAARRNQLYREARVALEEGDLDTAKSKAKAYAKQVDAYRIPFEVRQSHELAGRIALHEKDYAEAVAEFEGANQQDPIVLYLSAVAHEGQGDLQRAREFCKKAADFNGLSVNYAYVRSDAQMMLARIVTRK